MACTCSYGLYVFVVQPDQTVRQQDVQVAYQDDGVAVIAKGVSGGDSVVVGGQSRLAPGIRVSTSAAPPA